MDFRNVTDLFADPAFDGYPVMIKEVNGKEELTDQDIYPEEDREIIDRETGNPVDFGEREPAKYPLHPDIIQGGEIISERQQKIYVAGVDVSVLNERIQHLDANGRLITESLRDYTKKGILREFQSPDDFLARWNGARKKEVVIRELESHGIIPENLMAEVKKD